MDREKISLTKDQIGSILRYDEFDGFEVSDKEIIDHYDTEHGSIDYSLIVMRQADGKFFRARYYNNSGDILIQDQEVEEVFPQVRTIITYE